MNNSTWACFDCREAVRRPDDTQGEVPCPGCGQPCRYLGDRLRVPPKNRAGEWQSLRADLQQAAIAAGERMVQMRLQRMRRLRAGIERLESLSPNEGRAEQVRRLRQELENL